MRARIKKGIAVVLIALVGICGGYLSFIFTRPVVLVVFPSIPEFYEKRLVRVMRSPLSYQLKSIEATEIEGEGIGSNVALVIYFMPTLETLDSQAKSAVIASSHMEGYDITFIDDESAKWRSALLSQSDINTAFVAQESDYTHELFNYLKDEDNYLIGELYSDEITNVNSEAIINKLSKNMVVSILLYSPSTSQRLLSELRSSQILLDYKSAAAILESGSNRLYSISPRFNSAIKEALRSESGDISFDYTLRRSH